MITLWNQKSRNAGTSWGFPAFHDFTIRDPRYFVILFEAQFRENPRHFVILKKKYCKFFFQDFFWKISYFLCFCFAWFFIWNHQNEVSFIWIWLLSLYENQFREKPLKPGFCSPFFLVLKSSSKSHEMTTSFIQNNEVVIKTKSLFSQYEVERQREKKPQSPCLNSVQFQKVDHFGIFS